MKYPLHNPAATTPLATKPAGWRGVVSHSAMDERDGAVLRAMGLRPAAHVRVCRVGEPTIVEVVGGADKACRYGCRIGLCRDLASKVMVLEQDQTRG